MLKDYWTPEMRRQFADKFGENAPTTHSNCIAAFGVARPGKTKKDRAMRGTKTGG